MKARIERGPSAMIPVLRMRELLRSYFYCLAGCIAIIVFSAFVIARSQALHAANLQVRIWRDIEVTTERVLGALRDAETGQRGYLLTHEPDYLDPFEKARADVNDLTRSLEAFSSTMPQQRELASKITTLTRQKFAELDATLERARAGDMHGALVLLRTDRGKLLMDQLRALSAELGEAASQGARTSRAEADRATRNLAWSVVITSGLSVLLLVLLTYFLRRDGRRLRESAEELFITLESMGDAVVTTDAHGHVTYLNPVAAKLVQRGQPKTPTPFREMFKLVNETTGAAARDPIAQVLEDGKIKGLANHTALERADGTRVSIEDSAAPLRDADGGMRGVVFIFKDISERRVAERDLATARALLEKKIAELHETEAQLRLADRRKDEFLATLAHELRNPVAPIRHAIMLLENEGLPQEQQRWSRSVIRRQVGHMARLLDDLLDAARITRGELSLQTTAVDLQTIITDALDVAKPIIERKGHTLQVILPDQPVTLLVDGIRIAQVLSNLLTNAAKYTDPGGTITLKAESTPAHFAISVTDSGVGLKPDVIPHVFKMFSQIRSALDRSEGGLGIGLSLASELAQLHGGHIEVHSAGEGHGSIFTVALPPTIAALHAPAPVVPAAPGAPAGTAGPTPAAAVSTPAAPATTASSTLDETPRNDAAIRVLVIDDNVDAAASLGMLLELSGCEVILAHSGEEGLELARERRPTAVVIDIGLPGINGYQVAQTLRQEPWGRSLLLIALTGWGQTSDKETAAASGFNHHLTKPADGDAVQRLIASG